MFAAEGGGWGGMYVVPLRPGRNTIRPTTLYTSGAPSTAPLTLQRAWGCLWRYSQELTASRPSVQKWWSECPKLKLCSPFVLLYGCVTWSPRINHYVKLIIGLFSTALAEKYVIVLTMSYPAGMPSLAPSANTSRQRRENGQSCLLALWHA